MAAANGKCRVTVFVTYVYFFSFIIYILNWHVYNHNYCGAGGGWGYTSLYALDYCLPDSWCCISSAVVGWVIMVVSGEVEQGSTVLDDIKLGSVAFGECGGGPATVSVPFFIPGGVQDLDYDC